MRFNEEHKVIINTLTKEEAQEFIYFLQDEIKRHTKCIEEAGFKWHMRPIIGKIYESAGTRHLEDIKCSVAEMERVKEMFGL